VTSWSRAVPPWTNAIQPFHGFDEFKPFNRFARFQLLRTFSRKEFFGVRRRFVLSPTQLTELKWYRCFCLDFEIARRPCHDATR
jgi:hypothetical protein